MLLVLAPMEGLADHPMRELLTQVGDFDWCVTEFVRVTDRQLPDRAFHTLCPELKQGGRTRAGTPVHVQLLGSDPAVMGCNAARLGILGAPAIDINFGCPAKTVNRHRGGAVLLEEPEVVHAIVQAVRRAVPASIPVSAKMRLGYRDRGRMLENAQAIEAAGADRLTVHARTKLDGYRPPAHWEALGEIRAAVRLPMTANGDIFTPEDAVRCRAISGCGDLMLGRGAVQQPDLSHRIRGNRDALDWPALVLLMARFMDSLHCSDRGVVARFKQWLKMLALNYPEARQLFAEIRCQTSLADIRVALSASL